MAESRTLEVCRDFERGRCSRTEDDCRFAHPPPHVEVRNGKVTCCVDSLKDRCTRNNPPCRYLHPPRHLKAMILNPGQPFQRGERAGGYRNEGGYSRGGGGYGDGQYGGMDSAQIADTLRSYKAVLDALQAQAGGGGGGGWGMGGGGGGYGGSMGGGRGGGFGGRGGGRPDLRGRACAEVCREFMRGRCTRSEDDCRYAHPPKSLRVNGDNTITLCMDFVNGKCDREGCRYFHAPEHLQKPFQSRGGGGGSRFDRKRPHGNANGDGHQEEQYNDSEDYEPDAKKGNF